jgi:hypothetical protein
MLKVSSMSSRQLASLLERLGAVLARQRKTDHAIYSRVVEGRRFSAPLREIHGFRNFGMRILGLRILGLRILGLRILGLRILGLRIQKFNPLIPKFPNFSIPKFPNSSISSLHSGLHLTKTLLISPSWYRHSNNFFDTVTIRSSSPRGLIR